jgi:hypothetical protein
MKASELIDLLSRLVEMYGNVEMRIGIGSQGGRTIAVPIDSAWLVFVDGEIHVVLDHDWDEPETVGGTLSGSTEFTKRELSSSDESAWLIEMASELMEPLYWHAEPDMRCLGGFDPDVNKAMRFCREKDAQAMALMLGAKGMIAITDVRRVKVTEHKWPSYEETTEASPRRVDKPQETPTDKAADVG